MKKQHELEPRLSVVEKGQEALQKDLSELTQSVKEQGRQLESAITKLADAQISSFNVLSDKITSMKQIDWGMIGVLVLIIGAISTPVWMSFTFVDKQLGDTTHRIEKLEDWRLSHGK